MWKLPPPTRGPPRNASDRQKRLWRQQMIAWLDLKIDTQMSIASNAANQSAPSLEELAIGLAKTGDPKLLRRLYPQFADCIHPPPLARGKKYPKAKNLSTAEQVAGFARHIRALLRQQYVGQPRLKQDAEQFAIEVAKEFVKDAQHLTVDDVLAAAKKSGKHLTPRKKTPRKPRAI